MSGSLGEHLPQSEGEGRKNIKHDCALYSYGFPSDDFLYWISTFSSMTWRWVSGTHSEGPLWVPPGKTCVGVSRTSL